ncbi:membrane protein insertion efficiency factor YidD [Limnobaculum xujianqingii]|uniref:membrane protein insertion efficiency factor YidD n=1 Tax=Limnobaculum xujianqingii TaxID=2738837 RepID=UPI0015C0D156|nr:membrane protein insertion efficiency factor YidD [Limnobaculum xujianqingii]
MLARQIATGMIKFYQQRISPHKGFCCAYRYMTGKDSCSGYALKVVQRCGVLALFSAMPRQFMRCRQANLQYISGMGNCTEEQNKPNKPKKQSQCGQGCGGVSECMESVGNIGKCDCGGDVSLRRILAALFRR